jgi:thioredoxin-related protein
MKKWSLVLISFFSVLCIAIPSCFAKSGSTDKKEASNKEIQWLSFDELQVAMKKNPKKVFMDVYTDWCGWCKKMEKSTFTNPEVIKYINEHYYAIRFNAEQKEPIRFMGKTYETKPGSNTNELAIELLHGQMSYPTTVIFEENFLNPQPIPGYLDVPTCEMIVKYLGENLYRTKGFADYQKEFKATWH